MTRTTSKTRPGWTILAALSLAAALAGEVAAQDPPVWSKVVKLSDGRKFVTDGACLLDTAVARPPALPKVELSGPAAEMVERNFKAPTKTEVPYADLAGGERPGTYRAPNGTVLSARYVDYLRGAIGASELRFRVQGDRDATVVVSGATPVGLLMPMAR